MRNKLLVYLLTIFVSICLILSPNIVYNVSAAEIITVCNWDDVDAGLYDGESGNIIFHRTAGTFRTSTSGDLSPPNSFEVFSGSSGSWNLTYDFTYIYQINFSIYRSGTVSSAHYSTMKFYRNGTCQLWLYFGYPAVSGDLFYWLDYAPLQHQICSLDRGSRYYIVITHNDTNHFNIKVLNDTFGIEANADYAGYDTDDWMTFDQVTFTSINNACSDYFDDIKIDPTWHFWGDIPPGYLGINCYNETSGNNITDFNVLIVNQEGDTFFDYYCNNTWVEWGAILPQGNCLVTISKTNYYPRTYILDIEDGYFVIDDTTYQQVTIEAYLPPINLSALYYIQVIDEYLYPVEDARVRIQGFCGSTDYQNVSDTYTDGMGMTNVYLCWGRQYMVTISAEGFVTKTSSWIPDPSKYGSEYPKVFRIEHEGTDVNETYDPWDYIVFEGWMYTNDTIKINYEDLIFSGTINASFYTYEINASNMSSSLVSFNYTINDTFTFWVYNINSSRDHRVVLRLNHTTLGLRVMTILISSVNISDNINETDIENKITNVFGSFDLGYVSFFFIFIPSIVLLVIPGINHNGIGIIGCSLWLGFSSMYFGLTSFTLISPFIFSLGMILFIVKGGASKL